MSDAGKTAAQSAAGGTKVTEAAERPKVQPTGPRGGPFAQRANEKAMNFGPSLRRLLSHLAPQRLLLCVAIVLAIVGVAMSVVGPKILGKGTDVIFAGVLSKSIGAQLARLGLPLTTPVDQIIATLRASGQNDLADMIVRFHVVPGAPMDFHKLAMILLLVLAFYLASSIFMFIQSWLINSAVQRTIYRLRQEVEEKLNRLPLSYFDNQPRGEVLSRVTNDIDNVAQSLQQTLSQLLNALLTVIGVVVMMFAVSWSLALIALVTIPISVLITTVIGKQSQKQFVQNWKSTGELNAQIEEAYTGHALVKVFGKQAAVESDFAAKNAELYRAGFKSQFISGLIMPTMMFVGNLNYVVIAVLGGMRVASGTMNLGDVQAFIQYSRQFTQPLTQVASMANLLQSGVASAERVFQLLDADEESVEARGELPVTRGRVEFDHVNFSYSTDEPLIADLSLVAEPGQTVAIVGPTGAGKTTLVNLIMRFYELRGGHIRLDGVDIADVPRAALRSRLGMVLQDTWLFHGTIAENIAYGRPGATTEEIHAAAEAAYVDRFVHALPDGYETVIDEEGTNISAGEKQLVTIARAFLADPALLILDEATSSVDTRTEVLVQQAMATLRANRTSFVIAHRLSTIRDADVILVMEHGSIVEQGTHTELLEARGHYWDLYNSQFTAPIEDSDERAAAGAPTPAPAGVRR